MKGTKSIGTHKIGMMLAISVMAVTAAFGQQSGKLAQAQNENTEKLRDYTWKSRTEIKKGGETKVVRVDQVRYAVDGTLQQTQLSSTAPELPTGGLRGMIAKKKKEEFGELVNGLTTLAKSYGKLSPEKMKAFMENASVSPVQSGQEKLVRIQGSNVLQAGDSMTIFVDPVTRKQRKVEVRTIFEGKPVAIASEFRDLPDGANYMARSTVDFSADGLVLSTENYDHVREPRRGGVGSN